MSPPCFYNGVCHEGPNCPQCTTIEVRRANGGFVAHVMEDGWEPSPGDRMWPAICGYRPSSPVGRLIRNRGRWRDGLTMPVTQAMELNQRWCPKCLAKLKKTFDLPESVW